MDFHWADGFTIKSEIQGNSAVISANREGLLSLAGHLTALAEQEPGDHFHLDEYNSLEDGSNELIFVRIE